jgi:hypothetical protein
VQLENFISVLPFGLAFFFLYSLLNSLDLEYTENSFSHFQSVNEKLVALADNEYMKNLPFRSVLKKSLPVTFT